jgi:hypothetical protein
LMLMVMLMVMAIMVQIVPQPTIQLICNRYWKKWYLI